jgi:outer membrane murein-binding lipoprotein Lpp
MGGAEIVGGVVVFLMLVYRQVKTGTRDAWREEAEAQAARADRLSSEVATLVREVRALRDENAGLRKEVAALRTENRELREHIDRIIGKGGA